MVKSIIYSKLKGFEMSDENNTDLDSKINRSMNLLIFQYGLKALKDIGVQANKESGRLKAVFKQIVSYPIKTITLFVFAPFILICIVIKMKSIKRKFMAIAGILIASLVSYCAGTFLGSFAGALFIATNIGWISALGFILGSLWSVIFTFIFMLISFNAVSMLFVKMSSEIILEYLVNVIKGKE